MKTALEKEFDEAMLDIYREAGKIGYNARLFVGMVVNDGGVATAKRLIDSQKVSDGFTALWELKRLDLTVEAMILHNQKFWPLFTAEQLKVAGARLRDYGYTTAIPAVKP